jgi:cold shock CspA family protein
MTDAPQTDSTPHNGTIKKFFPREGWGFITRADTKQDVYFRDSEMHGDPVYPHQIGDPVTFEIHRGARGLYAKNVYNLSDPAGREALKQDQETAQRLREESARLHREGREAFNALIARTAAKRAEIEARIKAE